MVVAAKNDENKKMGNKQGVLITTLFGIAFLIIPVIFLYVDPIQYFAEYRLRLDNGSMLHGILSKEFVGPKIYTYLFNVSNAEAFISGKDQKIRLEESGPYVYQEYRRHEDLQINQEPGIMKYTPKVRVKFIPEESVADPKDVHLVMVNIPLLSAVTLMAKQSYIVKQIFNIYAASLNAKPFIKITAQDILWGYPDPLIHLANSVVPGLVYFNSTGLLERFYDWDTTYRLELGTTKADKFSVKKATKFKPNQNQKDFVKNAYYFNDTFEGAVFPPNMKPDMPIHIYKHGLCKTFRLQYMERRKMFYGGESFVYNLDKSSFEDHELCDSKGWCPSGLQNVAPCYLDLPFALSKAHFLDSEPRLLEMVDGLRPDRKKHDIELVVDPKIGVTISGSISLQCSLFLADVRFYHDTRRLSDLVIPQSHVLIKTPPMLEETKQALQIIYTFGPHILLATNIICIILGLICFTYSATILYWRCLANRTQFNKPVTIIKPSLVPLLVDTVTINRDC